MLADWGVKSIKGDKNAGCAAKVAEIIAHYKPDVIVLEDASIKPFRRSVRIRELGKRIVTLAERRRVAVMLCSPTQVRQAFFADGQGTKHAIAEILAKKYPEELGSRLPPKRRPWMSEDYRMDIFDAVALALVLRRRNVRNRMYVERLPIT
jgi:Holliday junction resolvasome RuvABC endonuclease subunit